MNRSILVRFGVQVAAALCVTGAGFAQPQPGPSVKPGTKPPGPSTSTGAPDPTPDLKRTQNELKFALAYALGPCAAVDFLGTIQAVYSGDTKSIINDKDQTKKGQAYYLTQAAYLNMIMSGYTNLEARKKLKDVYAKSGCNTETIDAIDFPETKGDPLNLFKPDLNATVAQMSNMLRFQSISKMGSWNKVSTGMMSLEEIRDACDAMSTVDAPNGCRQSLALAESINTGLINEGNFVTDHQLSDWRAMGKMIKVGKVAVDYCTEKPAACGFVAWLIDLGKEMYTKLVTDPKQRLQEVNNQLVQYKNMLPDAQNRFDKATEIANDRWAAVQKLPPSKTEQGKILEQEEYKEAVEASNLATQSEQALKELKTQIADLEEERKRLQNKKDSPDCGSAKCAQENRHAAWLEFVKSVQSEVDKCKKKIANNSPKPPSGTRQPNAPKTITVTGQGGSNVQITIRSEGISQLNTVKNVRAPNLNEDKCDLEAVKKELSSTQWQIPPPSTEVAGNQSRRRAKARAMLGMPPCESLTRWPHTDANSGITFQNAADCRAQKKDVLGEDYIFTPDYRMEELKARYSQYLDQKASYTAPPNQRKQSICVTRNRVEICVRPPPIPSLTPPSVKPVPPARP